MKSIYRHKRGMILFIVCALWFSGFEARHTLATGSSFPSDTSSGTPSIQVPQLSLDFGEATEDAEVVRDYTVKNTGGAELRIEKVQPG